jgi:tyrosine-protein kinase Etk/Wzc
VTQPDPIKPRKALIIVLGMLMGLMLSAGTVLVRSAFKRGITSSEQLEVQGYRFWRRFRARYGSGKNAPAQEKPVCFPLEAQDVERPFLPVDRPADMFVEAVRGLRTSLHFTMMDAANRIVVVSGPTQDCGKTLVSTSLASIAAQAGQRVLFIDADMRKGMSTMFSN